MPRIGRITIIAIVAACPALLSAQVGTLAIKAVNRLQIARPSETIELSSKDLAALGAKDLTMIHVKDAAGKELLCQAVDTDGDYTPDLLIFQADFAGLRALRARAFR
ncbi:MAG: hypothetical protein H6Q05_2313 [Acidobacteria bacterium]|nr:hypothetical protein [Acidobacteriota bacterium]